MILCKVYMFVYLFINVTGLDLDRGGFSVTRSTPGPTKFLQKVCFFVFLTPLVTRRHIYASKKGKNSCTPGYTPILFIICSVKGLCFCFQEQKTEPAQRVWFRFYNFLNIKNLKIFEKKFLTANRSKKQKNVLFISQEQLKIF